MMRTLVVVLNWNGLADTLECLDALAGQTHDRFDVLVIDNGSAGDDAARIRERLEILNMSRDSDNSGAKPGSSTHSQNLTTFVLHIEPENLGFAGGVNVGIRWAFAGDYEAIALLNNDAVPDADWLANLDAALSRTDASVAASLMLQAGDVIDTAGDAMTTWGMPFPRFRGAPAHEAPESEPVFSASGGASLYRTRLFRDIGMFDETFFAYFEDIDIGFRARLRSHAIVYEPSAVVHHKIGATSGKIPGFTVRQTFQNLPVLITKNVPRGLRRIIVPRFILLLTMMLAKATLTGSAKPAWTGLSRGIRTSVTHGRRERRRIQGSRTAAVGDIDAMLTHDLPPEQSGMRRLRRLIRRH
jgi:GT2 family glycosyltransferase